MEQKTLDVKEKQNVAYCIPLELRDEQIRINLRKVKGRVSENSELIKEPIAIVCFAPSLKDTWEEIKKFKYIMTCSGAHKFLVERGIIPTHHIDLDPRLHKLKLLGPPQKETEYLIASTIHPQYLDVLEGYNVKLWHIFANEKEGERILPRDEWAITGGSSVGLRCLTLARFLGFQDMHVFGMDGSFVEGSTHTAEHPNAPKESYITEYNGKKFLTTPSMLHVAQETFHELDQMPDCTFKFYGNGLVQEMAKDYKPVVGKNKTVLAFNKPGLISQEYLDLNKKLHEDNPAYGMGGNKHTAAVLKLSEINKTTDILDYGAGKMMLQKSLPFPIFNYDPAVPEISKYPRPAQIVVCTDVLEHIEPDKLPFVLEDLKFLTKKTGYFVISTRQAVKTYANGKNAHLIVQKAEWWKKQLEKYFEVGILPEVRKDEVAFAVGPKVVPVPETITVEKDGFKFKFLTPNDTTKWRANSLFKKEPSTIEWLTSMNKGEILYDIGANVGGYSVYAGVRGLKVYSFEPEAENYAILVKNLALNGIEPHAYCVALSDEDKAGTLYASGQEAGGACHSFNESVGHDLQIRKSPFTQGCFGITLDHMIEKGLPSPQHIKIDVDGFEYKVVQGAKKTLMNGVQSVLIEINPALPQHLQMISELEKMGFSYDPEQVKRAERKEGTFKGVAEYIFHKRREIVSALHVNSVNVESLHREMEISTTERTTSYISVALTSIISTGGEGYQAWANQVRVPEIEFGGQLIKDTKIDITKWTDASQAERGNDIIVEEYDNLEVHLRHKLVESGKTYFPFPYIYQENIFPEGVYEELMKELDTAEYTEIEKSRGTKGYPLRYTSTPDSKFWKDFTHVLTKGLFKKTLLERFGIKDEDFVQDTLLIRDLPGYQIPPHTDSLRKVISVLFYLPEDDSIQKEGTSIFIPKKKDFVCESGKHHNFDDFVEVFKAPFKPNSMLAFARTNNSFHGVFPSKKIRNVLLYNINRK